MANTYKWNIGAFELMPKSQGQAWVIHSAQWMLNATDGTGNYAATGGRIGLPYVPGQETFIPVEDVTEEIMIEWVQTQLGQPFIDHLYGLMDEHLIQNKLIAETDYDNPRRIVMTPPWSTNSVL